VSHRHTGKAATQNAMSRKFVAFDVKIAYNPISERSGPFRSIDGWSVGNNLLGEGNATEQG
jgi:hypothetical protein